MTYMNDSRRRVIALALLTSAIFLGGCSTAAPNVGFQAVLIRKPYLFGHGGVDPTPITTGQTWTWLSTDAIYVNMQPIQADLDLKDIMSSDGVPLEFDAIIRLQITNSVDLISRFGEGWYDNNVKMQFYNFIRQAVRKHHSNDTAINTSAIEAIDNEVAEGMKQYLKQINMPVNLIAVTVGKAIPPDAVKNWRIETAAQQQRIITEGQRKLAEDARKAAEQSRAEADNAFRNAMQMSPDQYLQLEQINMVNHVCSSGAKCTFISNGTKSGLILDGK